MVVEITVVNDGGSGGGGSSVGGDKCGGGSGYRLSVFNSVMRKDPSWCRLIPMQQSQGTVERRDVQRHLMKGKELRDGSLVKKGIKGKGEWETDRRGR